MQLDKTDLVNMICGAYVYKHIHDENLKYYIEFSGNQWSEDYKWNRLLLESEDEKQLIGIYNYIKQYYGKDNNRNFEKAF